MRPAAAEPSPRRFSVSELVLLVPWVALVIDAWVPIRDNSFLWHVRAGELQAEAASVLTTDPFSFTMGGEPWLTQSWLAELLYAWGEGLTDGLGFVPWMLLVTTTVTFLAVGVVAYARSGSTTATAIVLLLTTLLMLSFLVPRPVVFSFGLFALVLCAWESPRARWAVPFLFWIWASVHGSFAIGLAYIALRVIADREWRWIPTGVISALATLATAHGLGVITMLSDFGEAREVLPLLSEWHRPTLDSPVFLAFLAGVAAIVYGMVRRRVTPRQLWLLLPFVALAMTALRAVPPAWLGMIPIVAMALGPMTAGATKRLSRLSAVVFAVVVVAIVPFALRGTGSLSEERFPVAAASHLDDLPTFHDDRAGGYLIWARGPEFKVYIDDRAELYGPRLAEFVDLRDGTTDWENVFERDGIRQALLMANWDVAVDIEGSGWSVVHRDEVFVVLKAPGA